jgi:hypothetical protein
MLQWFVLIHLIAANPFSEDRTTLGPLPTSFKDKKVVLDGGLCHDSSYDIPCSLSALLSQTTKAKVFLVPRCEVRPQEFGPHPNPPLRMVPLSLSRPIRPCLVSLARPCPLLTRDP